ncbi:MAG: hypothetical protein KGI27_06110 [Thaumarchaeota archaeon]|nr:hypothetical protein [Nitrososphaerota archaeon]
MSNNSNFLKLDFDCRKITSSNIADAPELILQGSTEAVEKIKQDEKISRIKGEAYPVILKIQNQLPFDIKNLVFSAETFIKAEGIGSTYSLNLDQNEINISTNSIVEITLFDACGFSEVFVKLKSVSYIGKNKKSDNRYKSNSPLLININDFTNSFNGFSNDGERKVHLLLENYLNNSLPLRGWLLGLMFQLLKRANSGEIEIHDKKIRLTEDDLARTRASIQLDIISKIMMYIEDLIILNSAILESSGNYYELLDRKDPDVGERITKFFTIMENLKPNDFGKILSYVNLDTISMSSSEKQIVQKIMDSNIENFKNYLKYIKTFRETHKQIFRRYKHAGLPIRLGAKSADPFANKKFDSYAMIYVGSDPFTNVLPLPYSEEVIQSYDIMIKILQQFLNDVIVNKMTMIQRRCDGIIPLESYKQYMLTEKEKSDLSKAIEKFYESNPMRMYQQHHRFNTNIKKDDLKWYFDLDEFLQWFNKQTKN